MYHPCPTRRASDLGLKIDESKSRDGKVGATNAVSAATLISTSAALTRAESVVPIISSQVISSAIATAGRLMNPPGAPPSASGAAASQGGNWTPRNWLRIVPEK